MKQKGKAVEGNQTFKILLLYLWGQIYDENAYKIIVINTSKEKKITTYKHGLIKSQAKIIMQNNCKLMRNNLQSGVNLKFKKHYYYGKV